MNLDATTVALVLSALANAIAVWRFLAHRTEKREIHPVPLPVIEGDRYVTEKELEPIQEQLRNHAEEIETLGTRLREDYNTLMTSEARGRRELHKELNVFGQQLAGIAATVEGLKGLPERLSKDIGLLFGQLQNRK